MIHLHGDSRTPEYEAAQNIRAAILNAWPHMETSSRAHIWLVAGAKCHGQSTRDVDLLLLADLGDGQSTQPFLPQRVHWDEPPRQLDEVVIRTLCCAIEVKDHPPEAVAFEGTFVRVRYKNSSEMHDATTQNEKQVYQNKI